MTSETHGRFKRWFWRPPRPHGEIIADRQVSNLELLYDLVYVAVIGQAAHHLAEHVSVGGLAEFTVVFTLIWIAWINGSLYLELHGREDGRTRSIVFVQMGILVLLAVFTADGSGWGFAVVYAVYQVVQTGLWYSVWRQDRRDHAEFLALTGGYVVGMGVSATVILASALLPATLRLLVWAGLTVVWVVGIVLAAHRSQAGLGLTPTDSMAAPSPGCIATTSHHGTPTRPLSHKCHPHQQHHHSCSKHQLHCQYLHSFLAVGLRLTA
jgi:low temperature requirement protein LtrA